MKSLFNDIFSAQIGGGMTEVAPGGETTQNVSQQNLDEVYQALLQMCIGKDSIQVPSSEPDKSITINCIELQAGSGENITTAMGSIAADALFDNVYYKKYDCTFLDCLQTGQLGVVLSVQGHNFFDRMYIYSAVVVAISALTIIVASEKWPDRLKGLGWPLLFTGISYFFVSIVEGYISSKASSTSQAGVSLSSLINRMFEPMMNIFLITLVAGVVLTAGGYVLAHKYKRKSAVASTAKKN
jgi:hypothetical protein